MMSPDTSVADVSPPDVLWERHRDLSESKLSVARNARGGEDGSLGQKGSDRRKSPSPHRMPMMV
ncbi:hypothetical protein MC885_019350 [Smutsia gigantea]|nr:hypothetical protein MC885_019350 [Smutsia gigantea]